MSLVSSLGSRAAVAPSPGLPSGAPERQFRADPGISTDPVSRVAALREAHENLAALPRCCVGACNLQRGQPDSSTPCATSFLCWQETEFGLKPTIPHQPFDTPRGKRRHGRRSCAASSAGMSKTECSMSGADQMEARMVVVPGEETSVEATTVGKHCQINELDQTSGRLRRPRQPSPIARCPRGPRMAGRATRASREELPL
jgi:hypothetical protein